METCVSDETPLLADTGQASGDDARTSEPASPSDTPSLPQSPAVHRAKSIAPSACSAVSTFPHILDKCKAKLKAGCEKVERALKGKEEGGDSIVVRRNRNSDIEFFGEFPERRRSWLG